MKTSAARLEAGVFLERRKLTTYTVTQGGIALRLCQQQFHDVSMAMLACTHQRRGALVVSDIDVRPLSQQRLHHVPPAVTHSQHESGLPRLESRRRGQSQDMQRDDVQSRRLSHVEG